jgi:hypothetical protein
VPRSNRHEPAGVALLFSLACLTSVLVSIDLDRPWYLNAALVGFCVLVGFAGNVMRLRWAVNGVIVIGALGLVLEVSDVEATIGSGLVTGALSLALGGFVRALTLGRKQATTDPGEPVHQRASGWLATAYILEAVFLLIVLAAFVTFR